MPSVHGPCRCIVRAVRVQARSHSSKTKTADPFPPELLAQLRNLSRDEYAHIRRHVHARPLRLPAAALESRTDTSR